MFLRDYFFGKPTESTVIPTPVQSAPVPTPSPTLKTSKNRPLGLFQSTKDDFVFVVKFNDIAKDLYNKILALKFYQPIKSTRKDRMAFSVDSLTPGQMKCDKRNNQFAKSTYRLEIDELGQTYYNISFTSLKGKKVSKDISVEQILDEKIKTIHDRIIKTTSVDQCLAQVDMNYFRP